jgi:hypothetical protein
MINFSSASHERSERSREISVATGFSTWWTHLVCLPRRFHPDRSDQALRLESRFDLEVRPKSRCEPLVSLYRPSPVATFVQELDELAQQNLIKQIERKSLTKESYSFFFLACRAFLFRELPQRDMGALSQVLALPFDPQLKLGTNPVDMKTGEKLSPVGDYHPFPILNPECALQNCYVASPISGGNPD